jgi:hypothetical protein
VPKAIPWKKMMVKFGLLELQVGFKSCTTYLLLCHPKLEGGFSAGTKGVSIVAGIRTISLRGKIQEKTMPRKFIIKLRRSATMLYHPELEGAFSAGTKGVSIAAGVGTTSLFLFGGPSDRSIPFPLRPYEFPIFRTIEIPFACCSQK